jgi:hypothetical protein
MQWDVIEFSRLEEADKFVTDNPPDGSWGRVTKPGIVYVVVPKGTYALNGAYKHVTMNGGLEEVSGLLEGQNHG